MDKIIINDSLKRELDDKRIIIHDDFVYKKNIHSEKKMEHLNDASSKFTQGCYILAQYLLYYGDLETYIGFAMKHYKEYQTIKDLQLQKKLTFPEIIIRKLVLAIIDLKNNGFIYTDIHYRNILVNGKDILLADMDHVIDSNNLDTKDILGSIWCLVDLIIQIYFYDNLVQDCYVFDRFMFGWNGVADSKILTKEVEDYLIKVLNEDDSILSYDLYEMTELLIKEFSNQEKIREIKKMTLLP